MILKNPSMLIIDWSSIMGAVAGVAGVIVGSLAWWEARKEARQADEKAERARKIEAYRGFLSGSDAAAGKVIEELAVQRDNPDELTRGVAHAAVMELYSYDSRALQWRTDPIYESWNSLEAARKAFSEVLLTYVQEQDTGTVTTKTRDETQRRMGAFESEARRYQTECKKRLQALDKNVAR